MLRKQDCLLQLKLAIWSNDFINNVILSGDFVRGFCIVKNKKSNCSVLSKALDFVMLLNDKLKQMGDFTEYDKIDKSYDAFWNSLFSNLYQDL